MDDVQNLAGVKANRKDSTSKGYLFLFIVRVAIYSVCVFLYFHDFYTFENFT